MSFANKLKKPLWPVEGVGTNGTAGGEVSIQVVGEEMVREAKERQKDQGPTDGPTKVNCEETDKVKVCITRSQERLNDDAGEGVSGCQGQAGGQKAFSSGDESVLELSDSAFVQLPSGCARGEHEDSEITVQQKTKLKGKFWSPVSSDGEESMDDSDKWAIPPGQDPLEVGMEEEGEKDSEGVTQIERHIVEMEEKLEVERMKLERKLERRKSLEEAEEQETAKKKKVENSSEDAVLKNIQDDGNSQGMQQTDKSQSGGYGNGKKKGVEDSGKVTGSGGQQLSAPQNALSQRLPQPVGGNVRTMRIRKATADKGEVAPKTQKKEGKSMGKQGKKDGGEDGKVTNKKDTGPKKDPLEMALLGELGNSEDEMFEVPESFPSGKEEGRKMAKEKENELNVLQGRLQRMYGMARLGMDVVSEVRDLESQIEEVYLQRLDAVKNTARAEWVDGNEKCSRYFFKKVVEEKKTVEGWKDGQGRWRTKKEEMGELVVEFFEDLYSEKEVNPSESTASLTVLQDTLTLEQKKGLVEDFSVEELDKAMSSFGGDKSPGPDGLPIELYKEFWPALKSSLLEVCRERKIVGGAPKEFCEGVIVLLHKKGDRADLKNWRPITLLNADYKLYMKLLTQRVGALASGLISPDQITCDNSASNGRRQIQSRLAWDGPSKDIGFPSRSPLEGGT
ncbi:hypothetical protein NDU88_002642 [Pleurodeles waltl]|uniref:Reverse transcriptase domain-containing protein n=1 Tax=Pleurodeles waltl TaxID=8319 RepID=A0AAV7RDC0_PLEWA|nr:hypothetical protein NDU88_002638 [Pleurodeles waltl]KAJ1149842.1 hypothetical protein NDU88_002642 [Pleurodeles waltl]